jgi:hypothetical protein
LPTFSCIGWQRQKIHSGSGGETATEDGEVPARGGVGWIESEEVQQGSLR